MFTTDPKTGMRACIVVHRNNSQVPAFGATRFVKYQSEEQALEDAMNLSRIMSYKSALAGLKYGGAKGVILDDNFSSNKKNAVIAAYADKLNYLSGSFITGADAGIDLDEVRLMKKHSKFVVGLKSRPVEYTAAGLFYSLEACLKEYYGSGDFAGKSIAIQGLGKIGSALLKLVYNKFDSIYAADPDSERVKSIKKQYPEINIVAPEEIYKQKVNIFSPCALSGTLNVKTVKMIKADIICGGANNQLANQEAGEIIYNRDILYAPDYVVNAGGLISVVDEYEHGEPDPGLIIESVKRIPVRLADIFSKSKKMRNPTNVVANKIAENIFNNI